MNKLAALLSTLVLLAACGKQEPAPSASAPATAPAAEQPAAPAADAGAAAPADQAAADQAAAAPAETVSEMDDAPPATEQQQTASTTQPSLKLGGSAGGPPTSSKFKEGTNYQKIVPAQPTNAPPGKVEVTEVFWYGCGHCFALDPAVESWRKTKPPYIEFNRVPAMWNEGTRLHARIFYTAEVLGKLEELHTLIFREINVNGNQLNTVDKIGAFFQQHGVSKEKFTETFSSFAVESKLQRADFLNKRYRIQSVPTVIVNGKYSTDVGTAGGEPQLFSLIDELAAHEHGG